MLVGHAEIILAGLLTAANPLHAVLPPLDIAFQEDPSVAKKIVLGKVGRVFGVGACLVHAHETLCKVDVPGPLAVETGQDVREGMRWMDTRDIRRDVLLRAAHHCHRASEREIVLGGEWRVDSTRGWRWRV